MMNQEKIHNIVARQREFFNSKKTLPVSFRIDALKKLKKAILENEKAIEKALYLDLNRSEAEAYFCDIGPVIMEINKNIKKLRKWAKPELHFSGMVCFPSIFSRVYRMPYGVTLIISPFNFPIVLSLGVLVASIAGGNTAVIKTSSKSFNCTEILKDMVSKTFLPEYVTVVDGNHEVADMCLEERFDKIFYTGSPNVAKHIMEKASKNLTPVALELGGETGNWCVIRKDADIKDTARKIAFFKLCNSGQICININQIAVAKEIADEFVNELKSAFIKQIGDNPIDNPEYTKMINKSAYDKCENEAEMYRSRIVFGGYGNKETFKYAPTIIYPVEFEEPITNHELFNPLLSIVIYNDNEIDKVLSHISSKEHPLALYLFTKDKKWAKKAMESMQYGGGCINEVCLHFMAKGLPFGGTGHSGMGAYHGKYGFLEFTHPSTVLFGSTHFNLSLREHPYNGKKLKFVKLFEK